MEGDGAAGDSEDARLVCEELFAEGFADAAGGAGDEEGFAFEGDHSETLNLKTINPKRAPVGKG